MGRMVKWYPDMRRSNQPTAIIDDRAHHILSAQDLGQFQFGIDSILPADNCHTFFVKPFDGRSNQRQRIGFDGN